SMIPCNAGDWYEQANAWKAYGPITARTLNAQWHITAVSGIGLVQSCCGNTHTMPQVFRQINLEPVGPAWDFKKYQPDVLTICLGQNDGLQDSSIFVQAYIRFIANVRAVYPKTEIVLLSSPMAGKELQAMLMKYCTAVRKELFNNGDKKIHTFFFDKQYTGGCDSHPSETEHQEIAELLTSFIKKTMNW
ncbi:MAG: GDSL-type esterase/lipase family protein, partial [Ginsengibacter sp.]